MCTLIHDSSNNVSLLIQGADNCCLKLVSAMWQTDQFANAHFLGEAKGQADNFGKLMLDHDI